MPRRRRSAEEERAELEERRIARAADDLEAWLAVRVEPEGRDVVRAGGLYYASSRVYNRISAMRAKLEADVLEDLQRLRYLRSLEAAIANTVVDAARWYAREKATRRSREYWKE